MIEIECQNKRGNDMSPKNISDPQTAKRLESEESCLKELQSKIKTAQKTLSKIHSNLKENAEKYHEEMSKLNEKHAFMESIKWITGDEDVYFLHGMTNGVNFPPRYFSGIDRIEFTYDRESNSYQYIDSTEGWGLTLFNSKESLEKHILELYNSLDLDIFGQHNWYKVYNFLPVSQEAKDYLKNVMANEQKAKILVLKKELKEAETALKKELGNRKGNQNG